MFFIFFHSLPLINFAFLQREGELSRAYVRKNINKLKPQWVLIDDAMKQHTVGFNMNEQRPRLTTGWYELRQYYNLEGNCTIWFHEVDDSIFKIDVRDSNHKEIQVPGGPPPIDWSVDHETDSLGVLDFYPDFRFAGQSSQGPPLYQGNPSTFPPETSEPIFLSDDDQISFQVGEMNLDVPEQTVVQESTYEFEFDTQITHEWFSLNQVVSSFF